MLKLRVAATFTWTAVCLASGQETAFEAATIKPSQQADLQGRWGESYPVPMRGGPGTSSPGTITLRNASLLTVICAAYGMKRYQVSGPAWLQTAGFTIVAKLPADAAREQIRPMLQNLLAERFHMRAHRAMREMPVYELVVAKGGPKLAPARDPDGGGGTFGPSKGNPLWQASNQTGKSIAEFLSRFLDRPVQDSSGLSGAYDFTLYWAAEYPMVAIRSSTESGDAPDPAPTIFQALQDQLGLKLRPTKHQMEVLAIDSVDKLPTDN